MFIAQIRFFLLCLCIVIVLCVLHIVLYVYMTMYIYIYNFAIQSGPSKVLQLVTGKLAPPADKLYNPTPNIHIAAVDVNVH